MSKQLNIGVIGTQCDPTNGIDFDGRIIDDESVEFHFSCKAWLDSEGRNFEVTDEFADFDTVMNACNQDSEFGIRLYNAFKVAIHNMMLGFHAQTCTTEHVTIATVDEDGFTKLELALDEEEA